MRLSGSQRPALIVMMGLPATGKSAVAEGIARTISAPVFSVDPLEAALLRSGIAREQGSGYAAYELAATLARSQLDLGQSAVIDAVNPMGLVRAWWRDLAAEFEAPRVLIECVCSDYALHRRRVESRAREIAGFIYEPAWSDIGERRREYEASDEQRLILDAIRPLDENVRAAIEYVRASAR